METSLTEQNKNGNQPHQYQHHNNSHQRTKELEEEHLINHTSSSHCNNSNSNPSRVSDKPLVCLQYMTQQLCELASIPHHEETSAVTTSCPWSSVTQEGSNLLSTTLASATTAIMTYSPTQDTTPTSKRRRKEDAAGARRYSPEKRAHLRESLSQTGSLLDDQNNGEVVNNANTVWMMEDDDQSQLAGVHITHSPIPPSYRHHSTNTAMRPTCHKDDLSYTYSESEASPCPVAKDLMQELVWEKLDDDDNDDKYSYGGESYDSSLRALATTGAASAAGVTTPTRTLQRSNSSSLVGEVITVPEDVSSSDTACSSRSSSRFMTSRQPKTVDVDCRRVSDCSSNDSESSSSSEEACDSVSLTSQDPSLSSSSFSCSEGSEDSGVVVDRHSSTTLRRNSLSRRRRRVHFQDDHRQQLSPGVVSKKRKEQSSPSSLSPTALSPSRVHDRNRARTEEEARSPFLFPLQLQHILTDSLSSVSVLATTSPILANRGGDTTCRDEDKESCSQRQHPSRKMNGNHQEDQEASMLVDLTQDLKDIAIFAGRSSESLVTNLYHTLCEE